MTATEQARYEELYTRHLRALKLQGKRDKTIDRAMLVPFGESPVTLIAAPLSIDHRTTGSLFCRLG